MSKIDTTELRQALRDHFDFVLTSAMMESADNATPGGVHALEKMITGALDQLDHDAPLLEAATSTEELRKKAMKEFTKRLPVFVTSRQRAALETMDTPESIAIVSALFESVMAQNMPINAPQSRITLPTREPTEKGKAGGKSFHFGAGNSKAPTFN